MAHKLKRQQKLDEQPKKVELKTERISLEEATKLFGDYGNGKKITYRTVYTYTKTGYKGIILESEFAGGRIVTTAAHVEEFIERINNRRMRPAFKMPKFDEVILDPLEHFR